MRIAIITVGSRGDVQPFLALGLGLQQAGHSVTVVTMQDFKSFVENVGLGFAPIHITGKELAGSVEGQAWIESGQNFVRAIRDSARVLSALTPLTQADSLRACRDAEAIIYAATTAAMVGYHLAERFDVPCFEVALQPIFNPTRMFAIPTGPETPGFLPPRSWLAGAFNRLTFFLGQQVAWQSVRHMTNHWRTQELHLPAIPLRGPFHLPIAREVPVLHAYSPAVVSRPADWPNRVHLTGYWFLDTLADWQPPAALVDFLRAGPPPVAIGFGSMTSRNPSALTNIVVEALMRAGQRAVLITGWDSLTQAQVPGQRIFSIPTVPHDWLFPQTAAVVHHGGAGTTAAALRAGVPSIVVPFFADQFFWARRVAALGAGPRPIPRQRLTSEHLAAAIEIAVGDEAIRSRAMALGSTIRAERGVLRALEVFHDHLRDRVSLH